jgi:argininosuccinate lyase
MTADQGAPIWHKGTRAADWVTRFTVGDDAAWDTLLLPYDCTASEAHAWGLVAAGVLTAVEHEAIAGVLRALRAEHEAGALVVRVEDEDCHTVIERRLVEALGETGSRVHAGRSRNDQVLAALRLFLRDRLDALGRSASRLVERLCAVAADGDVLPLPGYTHTQRAMPSTVGLWALGFAELLVDDVERLGEARRRINRSPLGSAAGYGVPYLALPREDVARRLGFEGTQQHVTAVQLSRGKLEAEVVHAVLQLSGTLNRLASDLVLYASEEFGFVRLPEAFTTGSSIMPQKKNPDVLELARATFHRIHAELQLLLGLPANLASGYHRDLQLTKAAVMRSVLVAEDLVTAMNELIPGLEFREGRIREAMSADLFATAAAIRRAIGGEPFRDAYRAAAADPASWEAEADVPIEEAYRTEGGPGRTDEGAVLSRLQRAAAWIPAVRS